jgi:hypothetical protein
MKFAQRLKSKVFIVLFLSGSPICSQMATFAKYHASLLPLYRHLKVETPSEFAHSLKQKGFSVLFV